MSQFIEKKLEITISFFYIGKRIFFQKRAHSLKNLKLVQKTLFIVIIRKECAFEQLKTCGIYHRQRDLNPLTVGYLTSVHIHKCNMEIANCSSDDSALHGQNQENEKLQLLN